MATALITGATAGIGYELAKCFAADKYDLIINARNAERLQQVADELERAHGVKVRPFAADLGDPAAARHIFSTLEGEGVVVDFLVNNAGFGTNGPFWKTDLDIELEMLQVNMASLVTLTKLFLQRMVERNSGRIMNVASTAAFQPGPHMAIYCATKAFVLSFSEAVAAELTGTNVTVTALCPGATKTEFQDRAQINDIPLIKSGKLIMQADEVARIGYRGMMRGQTVVVTGLPNKIGAFAIRLTPRKVAAHIAGRMMAK